MKLQPSEVTAILKKEIAGWRQHFSRFNGFDLSKLEAPTLIARIQAAEAWSSSSVAPPVAAADVAQPAAAGGKRKLRKVAFTS